MKIHLRQIPAEGKHVEGEEDCLLGDLESQGIRCAGPMRYSLNLGLSDGSLWANGQIGQRLEMTCVSCLEPFEHDLEVPAFAFHTELRGPETIDISPFLREDLLLNLPAYPRCDRDGGRVCKGAKLARATPEPLTTEEKREHDWGELDKLNL